MNSISSNLKKFDDSSSAKKESSVRPMEPFSLKEQAIVEF
jgi:hypothetical protein